MINNITSSVVNWLIKQGVVSCKDRSLFAYAAYCILFGFAPIFIILVLGTISGMVYEGLILITPFIAIRKFSGGYHLKSAKLCFVLSVITLSLALFFVKIITERKYYVALTYAVLISVLILYNYSPIDSDARKLSSNEKRIFQKIARTISIISFGVYLFLFHSQNSSCSALGMGIIISALLQIPYIIENRLLLRSTTQ